MSEHHAPPGPDPSGAKDDRHEIERARVKAEAARKKQEAEHDLQRAQRVDEEARAEEAEKKAEQAKQDDKAGEKPAASGAKASKEAAKSSEKPAGKKTAAKPSEKEAGKKTAAKPKSTDEETLEVVDRPITPKQKPELDAETAEALEARAAKKAATPHFRRHEWWRYKRLGGKDAPWRRPRGIHSKQRRHFKYRPPVVSIGYRGPRAARGLHPSGFEEVLVYRPEDLGGVDPKTQAARVGGTVGGRKAEMIEKEADKLGIRVLNRRQS